MKDFMKMTGAVAFGTLMASGVAVSLLFNKRFLKAYTKKVMAISTEISNEIMEDMNDDYED